MLFSLFCTPQISVSVFCTVSHSSASVHYWPCPVLSAKEMKSTKVQTSPIYRNRTLEHLPQSTEPHAVLGSKYVMAKPAQFVKLSER